MRIALCAMPELSPWIQGEGWHIPNLALCNIAGNTPGHELRVFDLNRRRRSVRRAVERILDHYQPDILGLSAMTFQYDTARSIAWLAKKKRPQIVTVLGGYHASMMYREIGESFDSSFIDWIVRGEGDSVVAEIAEVVAHERDPGQVLGASWRGPEGYVHNPDRPLQDLARLSLPARNKRAYIGAHLGFWPADVMETSRGCTLACTFCSINQMYGRSHRFFPIDHVLADVARMSRRLAKEVFVADDNITNDLDRLEALCDALIGQRRKQLSKLRLTTQATCAGIARSQRLVDKMARAGFVKVFLGIENVSAKTLVELRKGNIVELARTAVRRLHEAGIICVGGCITGFAQDNVEAMRENLAFFKSLNVDHTIVQIITPYPGTSSREEALDKGYVTNRDVLHSYDGYWANVRTDHLSSADLEFWRWKLTREVIGPFRAGPVWLRHYPISGRLWNHAFLPLYKAFDAAVVKLLGERWRYERQRDGYRQRDVFDLDAPPVPFRVQTKPPRERSFSLRGIQGWTTDQSSDEKH